MRSGIYSFTDSEFFINTWSENPTKFWHTDSLIAIAASHPYYFDQGTGFHSCSYFMGTYDPEYPEYSESIDISWAVAAISTLSELKIYVESLLNFSL